MQQRAIKRFLEEAVILISFVHHQLGHARPTHGWMDSAQKEGGGHGK